MRLATIQADALLRQRHPNVTLEPLRSAEPEPLPDELPEPASEARRQHATLISDSLNAFGKEIESRTGVFVPNADPDRQPEGEAWPDMRRPEHDAVLQPPRPLMPAARKQRERQPEPRA